MFSLSPLVINKNFAQTFGLINAVTLNILIQEMEYKNLNTYEDYINMTLTQLCKFTYLDEKLQKYSLEQLQHEEIINCIHNEFSQTYSIKINEENIIKKLTYDTLITNYYKDELSKDTNSINNEDVTRGDVSTGYVYIFKCDKYYKIGLTKDVTRRLNQLNVTTPIAIECVYTSNCIMNPRTLEKNLHILFCQNNVQGEWFNLSAEELTIAKNVVKEYEKKNKVN